MAQSASAEPRLWYSELPQEPNQTVRIYAAIPNTTGSDVLAKLEFVDGDQVLGSLTTLALVDVDINGWLDWTVSVGDHSIFARIVDLQKSEIGLDPSEVSMAVTTTAAHEFVIVAPAPVASETSDDEKTNVETIKESLSTARDVAGPIFSRTREILEAGSEKLAERRDRLQEDIESAVAEAAAEDSEVLLSSTEDGETIEDREDGEVKGAEFSTEQTLPSVWQRLGVLALGVGVWLLKTWWAVVIIILILIRMLFKIFRRKRRPVY